MYIVSEFYNYEVCILGKKELWIKGVFQKMTPPKKKKKKKKTQQQQQQQQQQTTKQTKQNTYIYIYLYIYITWKHLVIFVMSWARSEFFVMEHCNFV